MGKEREIGPSGKPEMREALTTAAIVSSADTLTHSPVWCSHTWDVLSQVIACVISFVLFTDVVDVWWRKLVTPSAY